jgi:hypothetical protein
VLQAGLPAAGAVCVLYPSYIRLYCLHWRYPVCQWVLYPLEALLLQCCCWVCRNSNYKLDIAHLIDCLHHHITPDIISLVDYTQGTTAAGTGAIARRRVMTTLCT